jgi:hypothetical protein
VARSSPCDPRRSRGKRISERIFVNFAGDEMNLLIDAAMDLGMNSGESINQGALGAPLAEKAESSRFYENSHA